MYRFFSQNALSHGFLLAQQALVNLDPTSIVGTSTITEWTNLGVGGASYDLDTVVGTGANMRRHPTGSCILFGASGDYASTPDSVANSITGDIDIRAEITLPSWTPSADTYFVGKDQTTSTRSYTLYYRAGTGTISLGWSADGSAANVVSATVATGFAAGTRRWVRGTLDVDNGAGGRTATFYTSTDGVNWTQLGDTVTTAGVTSIFDSTSVVEIGSIRLGTTGQMQGTVYRAQIYNGINGTLAVDFNPLDYTSGTTFVSDTGETWTLNGNCFIQNTGNTVVKTIGSAALETTAGQTINSPVTIFMVGSASPSNPTSTLVWFDSRSSATDRMIFQTESAVTDKFTLYQGTAFVTLAENYDTSPHVWTGQFNGNSTSKLTVSGVGNATGDAGSANFDFGTIFAARDGTSSLIGSMGQLLVFNRALSGAEIAAVQTFLAAKFGL